MTKKGLGKATIPYKPRDWQRLAEQEMKRFTVLVMHRRAGKTVFDVMQSIRAIFSCPYNKPRAAYIGVTLSQTRDTAWDYYKQFLAPFNRVLKSSTGDYEELIKFNEAHLNITISPKLLRGGGKISLYSYEKPDSILGNYLDHVILDEFQVAPQRMFGQIIRPMLADRQGKCIITGTPRGKNQFFDFYERGLNPEFEDWTSILMDYSQTNALREDEIKSMREESTQEEFDQEMKCSFEAAIKGSFFGSNIRRMRDEERIIDKEYDPANLVGVAVDIGLDGYAMWYFQKIKGQIILIDADFVKDKDTREVIPILLKKPYTYAYVIVPHDGDDRNAANKAETPAKIYKRAGFKVKKAKKYRLINAIRDARKLLDSSQMTKKCSEKKLTIYNKKIAVIDALALYRAEFDLEKDKMRGADNVSEYHDDYSHLGSALRTLAVNLEIKKLDTSNLKTPSQFSFDKPLIEWDNKKETKVKNTWNPFDF